MIKKRIYEIFRKTKETYICCKVNLDGLGFNKLYINIFFFKHMLEQFVINSLTNLYLLCIGDIFLDTHHILEDLGIILGKIFYFSLYNKNIINRYAFFYLPLDESLTRIVLDICGRSYLKLNIFYNKIYINNFDVDVIYDFLISFVFNFKICLHISNIYGYNIHHKIESIFKSLGKCLKISLFNNYNLKNSSKGFLF